MAKILLVEDDPRYAALVCDYLTARKHEVEITSTVSDAQAFLDVYVYEILIVDWQLPDIEGPAFIKSLRSKGVNTAILMLTARDAVSEKEHGFNCGADDYVCKSADPRELLVRIQALLRRPQTYKPQMVRIRDVSIDCATRTVVKDTTPVHLLPKEFAVLEFMIRYPNRVFSAEELLERLWPSDTEATIHTVRSCINKIRTKLDEPEKPSLILTKYKAGYQINPECE